MSKNRKNMQYKDKEWVSIQEAADHYGVSYNTIRRFLQKESGIETLNLGQVLRINRESFDAKMLENVKVS